jgi:hypothetical protein
VWGCRRVRAVSDQFGSPIRFDWSLLTVRVHWTGLPTGCFEDGGQQAGSTVTRPMAGCCGGCRVQASRGGTGQGDRPLLGRRPEGLGAAADWQAHPPSSESVGRKLSTARWSELKTNRSRGRKPRPACLQAAWREPLDEAASGHRHQARIGSVTLRLGGPRLGAPVTEDSDDASDRGQAEAVSTLPLACPAGRCTGGDTTLANARYSCQR